MLERSGDIHEPTALDRSDSVSGRPRVPICAPDPRFARTRAWHRANSRVTKKGVRFSWDTKKARENGRRHGVSFEEAATCFEDPKGVYLRNEAPSYEDRLILIGASASRRVLFVVHAEVGRDAIRIVSARKASKAQIRIYEELD